MDLNDPHKNKKIKTIFIVFLIIMGIEIAFASILFIAKNNKKSTENSIIQEEKTEKESPKPITQIEQEAINKKNEAPTLPIEIDTNPRTRPLPPN